MIFEIRGCTLSLQLVVAQVLQPLYGCDCYSYGLLASGFCDLVVEASMKPYDYMAQIPIIQGAGGIVSDWQVRHIFEEQMECVCQVEQGLDA